MIIDLHVHTIYSGDSLLAPEDLIEQAIELGLDGVCVMEHDSMQASETAEQFAAGTPLKVFRGVEATTDLGHILVYGVSVKQWRPLEGQKGIQAQKLVDFVRDCGGACVPAHPFRFNSPGLGDKIETLAGIFAIEGFNGKSDAADNLTACEAAARLNLKVTGGSDAHLQGQVGKCVTRFENRIETMAELVEQLKSGRFEANYLF